MWNASRFCVSSLRRGHANLLCIVPILVYVLPEQVQRREFGMQSSIRDTFAEALCKWLEKEKRLAYSTKYSQAVSHSSTNLAQCCLTAVI